MVDDEPIAKRKPLTLWLTATHRLAQIGNVGILDGTKCTTKHSNSHKTRIELALST
jgi:hypothetical protein